MTPMDLERTRAQFYTWLQSVHYQDWKFAVVNDDGKLYLQIKWIEHCSINGKPAPQSSRKWLLSQYMTKSEFIQTCLKAVLTAVEHEAREHFKYKGEAVYRPHYDVDALHALCVSKALDCRKEKVA